MLGTRRLWVESMQDTNCSSGDYGISQYSILLKFCLEYLCYNNETDLLHQWNSELSCNLSEPYYNIYADMSMQSESQMYECLCTKCFVKKSSQWPLLLTHALTLIPAWISNCIHYKVWDEITYPWDHLIFIMEIHILVRQHLYIEIAPLVLFQYKDCLTR